MCAGHFCFCFSCLRSQADVPSLFRVCTTNFPSRLALYYTTHTTVSHLRLSSSTHILHSPLAFLVISFSLLFFSFPIPVSWFWFYLSAFVAAYVIHQTFIHTHLSLSHILSYILDSVCGFIVLYAHCICLLFSLHFFRGLCTVWPGHLTRRPSPTAGFVSPSSASTSHSPELFAWTSVYHHHPALSYLCTCRTLPARLRATSAPASIALKSTQH